jgi:hypothetical protein
MFLVNCQLIQKSDCQLNQEKSNKLSTKIRKRHNVVVILVKVILVIFDFGNAVICSLYININIYIIVTDFDS